MFIYLNLGLMEIGLTRTDMRYLWLFALFFAAIWRGEQKIAENRAKNT